MIGSGRTDTGVHATGQVIAFDVDWRHPDDELLRAINAVLPEDIALQHIAQQPGFHPRFDASSRCYAYTVINAAQRQPLWRGRAWYVWGSLDIDVLHTVAALLVGEHDFATFGSPTQGTSTIRRVIRSGWQVHQESFGQRLVYEVEANGFLYRMVRRMVGMQMDVARGLLTLDAFEAAFGAGDLSLAGTVAPPQGLVLETVRYNGQTVP